MVASFHFSEMLREQLAPLVQVTLRPCSARPALFVFMGLLAWCATICSTVRVDDDNRAVFTEAEAFPAAFNYGRAAAASTSLLARAGGRLFDEPDNRYMGARGIGRPHGRVGHETRARGAA